MLEQATFTTRTLQGTPVVPGLAYGRVVRPAPAPSLPAPVEIAEADRDAEAERFTAAASSVADSLAARAAGASGVSAEVLQATAVLARDRGLTASVVKAIRKGTDAPNATSAAVDQFAGLFRQMGGLMAERVTDLYDLRDRIVAQLTGQPEPGIPTPAEPSVLLADDLAPADTAGLDPSRVTGLATRLGGPTSHTAIIARQLGIPCVVAVAGLEDIGSAAYVLVDGSTGVLQLDPDPVTAQASVDEARTHAEAVARWRGPGRTADGHAVQVLANVQDGAGARTAAATEAEGVGLFRTELCFLSVDREPTVEEQADIYGEVLQAFAGRKVVVRTLDAGSDKPLAFAGMPDEANPALGVRGLRIAFSDPGILDRQLDAIALAAERTGQSPWVMAPMVATVAEASFFAERVRARGLVPGVMVEVPSAALLADRMLEHVEFLSIGTNDLTQYTMAADRLSAELAALTDPWQPALLALVAQTARAGQAAGKPVGVCGEAAADPLLGCVLAGLGITSLSAAAAALPAVGAALSEVDLAGCRAAAEAALAATDPISARTAARAALAGG
ncbi:MAG: Phosphoenolpyruvate-protein phosphotransferase of PTS system [uncultured Frankineae bacterium]|uniref:Phosphoenolpyruvate-protein phosphotransferase n=1 Tax=uncultured Frankineae bacterium TaxID=437475 RepID=A0A6J4LJB8_9ACTN|nr:MAG: Phosphoenolpyruvate-protein phosphotransferase of PTS system [uncultured Frankineae bacterium]